ncbi:MAG: SNF2-related protein [Spirochaetaceae bacterium]|jgi:SNF2 family DNA or RNA helicase|nr:SNF2-related protein [Spirochaetaceae bacterium]
MPRELIAVIEPHGNFLFDLEESEAASNESEISLTIYNRSIKNPFAALLFLGFLSGEQSFSPSIIFFQSVSRIFIRSLTRTDTIEKLREKTIVDFDEHTCANLIQTAPFMTGSENLSVDWMHTVWAGLNSAFAKEIKGFKGSVSDYFSSRNSHIQLAGRIFFHLVENKHDEEPFAFLATYSAGISDNGKSKHLPLNHALTEFGSDTKKLLELLVTVQKAAEKSDFVSEILSSKEIFYPLKISSSEALTILREIPLYESYGIICRIPDWWKQKSNTIKVTVKVGDTQPSYLSLKSLLSVSVNLLIDGAALSLEEVKHLLSETEGLALIKNRWVEIDHTKLTDALRIYEEACALQGEGTITMTEALRLHIKGTAEIISENDSDKIEITHGEWLSSVFLNLSRPDKLATLDCGNNFRAELRNYQQKGLQWLHYMRTLGLGACLADDMGLGKTIQIIALLNHLQKTGITAKTLIIVPASLLGNWLHELNTFAPDLSCSIIHPSEKNVKEITSAAINQNSGLFITTYGLLSRYKWLHEIEWDTTIIDEAQAIKNPQTAQTKAVKKLHTINRVAMTGTPIENRLSDLWSLFDFLNPGLLGSAKEFTSFCKKLKDNPGGYARLKQTVSPFILRRMKTDKTIITDLPEKIEMKSYAALSKKQTILYLSIVDDIKKALENAGDGIQRRGLILASMMRFKQICNHPDQYTGQKEYAEEDSGKFARLREICSTIREKRERVLIFTQFKEITEPLAAFLENVFGHKGLVLHGGVPVKKRKELVDSFQGHSYVPFIILSIKAGGVGLNLTAASHVIHFDRWWNPAVENQATDRAFRIGQKKNVIVHKFITAGTREEKIDLMIESKMALSRDVISDSQESLITEMSNEELFNLISLNQ